MKQTAIDNLLKYFIKEQKNGRSHWCIHDLIAQLYVAKEMEKKQICNAWENGYDELDRAGRISLNYYNETYETKED